MKGTPEPEEAPPLPVGERVVPDPQPDDDWHPKPGSPGIEVNAKGQMRTNLPLPRTNYGWIFQGEP